MRVKHTNVRLYRNILTTKMKLFTQERKNLDYFFFIFLAIYLFISNISKL